MKNQFFKWNPSDEQPEDEDDNMGKWEGFSDGEI